MKQTESQQKVGVKKSNGSVVILVESTMSLMKCCGQQSCESFQPTAVLLLAVMVLNTWSVGYSRTVQGVLSSGVARRERGQYISSFAFHGKHFSVVFLVVLLLLLFCIQTQSNLTRVRVATNE